MAATLTDPPPARAYAHDPIWATVETDLIDGEAGYFEITIADGGPAPGDTLTLSWPGGSITYTVGSADTSLNWPEQSILTLEQHTNDVANFLRFREDVGAVFDVSIINAASGIIRLTAQTVETFALDFDDGDMTNVTVTKTDGTPLSSADNLRAFVQVWTYTGDFNADRLLAEFHSPYAVADAATDLDISAAFAHLKPHLPTENSIRPIIAIALVYGEATDNWQPYRLRLADKYGSPAVAEGLLLTEETYVALHGSKSLDSANSPTSPLRHAYARRDGADFVKPVRTEQPDWVYWVAEAAEIYVSALLLWSDGTESVFEPWGDDLTALTVGQIYWLVSGYRQLRLQTVSPSGGTAPDAYIVGYHFRIYDGEDTLWLDVPYTLLHDSAWGHYLMFDNGVAGMETVWLRGKSTEGYATASEEYQRPRQPGDTAIEADFSAFAASGRPQWELSTGWYADPYYLEHLRQLPLASGAWLVDTVNRKFRKVIVQPGTLEDVRKDDETLYSLKFTIKAAWEDSAANI